LTTLNYPFFIRSEQGSLLVGRNLSQNDFRWGKKQVVVIGFNPSNVGQRRHNHLIALWWCVECGKDILLTNRIYLSSFQYKVSPLFISKCYFFFTSSGFLTAVPGPLYLITIFGAFPWTFCRWSVKQVQLLKMVSHCWQLIIPFRAGEILFEASNLKIAKTNLVKIPIFWNT